MQEAQEVIVYYWGKKLPEEMFSRVVYGVRSGKIWSFSMVSDPEKWNPELLNAKVEVIE